MATSNKTLNYVPGAGPLDPPASGSSRVNVGPTERALSVAGGAVMTYFGLRKPSAGGMALALLGGSLLYRGATGYCSINAAFGRDTANQHHGDGLVISRSVTINKPREQVYAYWRRLENLPQFMKHLARVTQLDNQKSHWEAEIPGNLGTLEWDATITAETPGERIAWQSVAEATVDNAGEVIFRDAPGDYGTELHATISYRPPVGDVGKAIAGLFNKRFEEMIKADLQRFKRMVETGEIELVDAQTPTGASATGLAGL